MRRRASGDTDANGCAGDARRAGRERGGIRGVAKRIPARGHVGTRFRKPVRSKYTVGRRGGRTDLHGGTRCGTRGNGLCHGGCDAGVRSGSADAALAQLPPPTPVLNTCLPNCVRCARSPEAGGEEHSPHSFQVRARRSGGSWCAASRWCYVPAIPAQCGWTVYVDVSRRSAIKYSV